MGLPVSGGLGGLHGSAGHSLYRQPQCGPGLAQCARGGRKVRGRWEEGGRKGSSSRSRSLTSSSDVMDAGRSVNSTFSVANLLDGAGAGMGYLRIGGRSAGSSQSGRHAYSETFSCRRGGIPYTFS